MIVINKLYRKDFNQYNIEDWKYIFSIYKMRDKYNHTEEEFLAAELVDKTAMMKKMDESLYTRGTITIDEQNKPLVDSCSQDSCEVINNFLDDQNLDSIVEEVNVDQPFIDFLNSDEEDDEEFFQSMPDAFYNSGNKPACKPQSGCEVIQDFLEEGGIDKFSIFRSVQNKCYEEIYQCQNRIEECKKKIRAEIQDIQVYKQRLDEAFNQYIE